MPPRPISVSTGPPWGCAPSRRTGAIPVAHQLWSGCARKLSVARCTARPPLIRLTLLDAMRRLLEAPSPMGAERGSLSLWHTAQSNIKYRI